MDMIKFEFTPSAEAGLSFKKLVIKETSGPDELRAKALAKAKGDDGSLYEEMVKLSIVSIDDKPVDQPFESFLTMSTKDRSYIGQAFSKINSASDDLVANFLSTSKMIVS